MQILPVINICHSQELQENYTSYTKILTKAL